MRLIFSILLVGIAFVFYLSWVPDPRLSVLGFMPDWLARWTDAHANEDLRTGVPFVFLGLCAGFWPANPYRSWSWWLAAWLILLGIVVIAEAGQLLLPRRTFSWSDVGWGAIGALAGLVVSAVVTGIKRRSRA